MIISHSEDSLDSGHKLSPAPSRICLPMNASVCTQSVSVCMLLTNTNCPKWRMRTKLFRYYYLGRDLAESEEFKAKWWWKNDYSFVPFWILIVGGTMKKNERNLIRLVNDRITSLKSSSLSMRIFSKPSSVAETRVWYSRYSPAIGVINIINYWI